MTASLGILRELWRWRPYQLAVLLDTARLICVVKARQIGLTELAAMMAVIRALSQPRHDVWLVGVNHEGSKEILWRAKAWYEALCLDTPGLPGLLSDNTESLVFANKSRITALPCTAKALRGKTGDVILDEAAHYAEDEEIWKAIAPVITSNKRLRLIMFSTPNGEQGTFFRAARGLLDGGQLVWSKHVIDVHRAIAEGHSPDVLDLRAAFTAEQWAQEFECSFLSQQGRYYPIDLIRDCYEIEIPADCERVVERRVLGIDLAQRQDQSVMIDCDWDGEAGWRFHSPIVLSSRAQRATYAEQYDRIVAHLEAHDYDRVCVDATGPGAGLASFLRARFGSVVREVTMTHDFKAKYIPALRVDMEAGHVELAQLPALSYAFNAVREERTTANNVVYRQARDEHGHADLFSAALLGYGAYKRLPHEVPAPPRISKRASKK